MSENESKGNYFNVTRSLIKYFDIVFLNGFGV